MCLHNYEDYDCYDCAFENGLDDKLSEEPYNNPYKNWDQVNAYNDGYFYEKSIDKL